MTLERNWNLNTSKCFLSMAGYRSDLGRYQSKKTAGPLNLAAITVHSVHTQYLTYLLTYLLVYYMEQSPS